MKPPRKRGDDLGVYERVPFAAVEPPAGAKRIKVEGFERVEFGYVHKPGRGTGWTWCGQRLAEVESLMAYRHGGDFDTPPVAYFRAAAWPLHWLASRQDVPEHRRTLLGWARRLVPTLVDEHGADFFDELEANMPERSELRRADTVANLLAVSREERIVLGLRTIGAVGLDRKERAIERRKANAAHQREKRARAGATPRELSRARSGAWTWQGRPVSRATYYRLVAAERETSSSASFGVVESLAGGHGETSSSASWSHETSSSALGDVVT